MYKYASPKKVMSIEKIAGSCGRQKDLTRDGTHEWARLGDETQR
jgi:hypothetical protein